MEQVYMGMKEVHFATSNSLRCLPVLFHCIFFCTSFPQALQYQVGIYVSGMTQVSKDQLSHILSAQETLFLHIFLNLFTEMSLSSWALANNLNFFLETIDFFYPLTFVVFMAFLLLLGYNIMYSGRWFPYSLEWFYVLMFKTLKAVVIWPGLIQNAFMDFYIFHDLFIIQIYTIT